MPELLNQSKRRQGLRFNLYTSIAIHNETQAINDKAVDLSTSGCAILTDTEIIP
ncbi:MAG: PilZ domain-containing protein [Pelovirga sp.]